MVQIGSKRVYKCFYTCERKDLVGTPRLGEPFSSGHKGSDRWFDSCSTSNDDMCPTVSQLFETTNKRLLGTTPGSTAPVLSKAIHLRCQEGAACLGKSGPGCGGEDFLDLFSWE